MNGKDNNLSLLDTANAFIEQNKLNEAAIVLNQARLADPKDPRVFMMAGLMAEKSGNTQGAIQLMRTGLSLAPDWAPGLMSLAKLHVRVGEFSQALELAEDAVERDGQSLSTLEAAAAVAASAGATEALLKYTEMAIDLQPDNSKWHIARSQCLRSLSRHEEAINTLTKLLERNPQNDKALTQRMYGWLAVGDLQAARADSQALLQLDPSNPLYQYYDTRASGKIPLHQPTELNKDIFDKYASSFDSQLEKGLHYQLPQLVAQSLLAHYPNKKFNLLDLGCGTGLLGKYLGRITGRLVGVDVSPKMLEEARKLKVYDHLTVADLTDTLQNSKSANYEVVTALDVFLYIGELSSTVSSIYRALVPQGQLIFSCEAAAEDGPDLILHPLTERYAHKRSHVEVMCRSAGFTTLEIKDLVIRFEKGQPVKGFVVTAFKPQEAQA